MSKERLKHRLFPFLVVCTLFALFIGYRFEVGGDWGQYLGHYKAMKGKSLVEALSVSDPGYAALNWLMYRWNWGIYGVNMACAIVFLTGLVVCCRQQTRPWLGFAVAFPYLVVVMAMGYTRQGVALGLFLLAIAAMERGYFKRYLLYITAAALFHKTALLMIALGVFLHYKNWKLRVIAVFLAGAGLWDLLLVQSQETLWHNYVETQMVSHGAMIRVLMNLIPSLFLLFFHKQWKSYYPNYRFWMVLAVASVISVGLVDFASTAVDRVALYFTPLQIIVFSRLPTLMHGNISPKPVTVGIILGYALVLFVWLNYAIHAKYWLPYQNWLLL